MKNAIVAMFVIFLFAFTTISAQEKQSSNTPAMKRPGPDAERVRLSFLVGKFVTETTIPPNPRMKEGAKGTGTSTVEWTLDSMFLSLDERSANAILGKYHGHGMLGYDIQQKRYSLSMFNNFGDHPRYEGAFEGDTLVLGTRVPMPGGAFDQQLRWFPEGDKVRLRIFNDFGQGFKLVIDQMSTPSSADGKK